MYTDTGNTVSIIYTMHAIGIFGNDIIDLRLVYTMTKMTKTLFGYMMIQCILCATHARLPHSSNFQISHIPNVLRRTYGGELYKFRSASPVECDQNGEKSNILTEGVDVKISKTTSDKIKQGLAFGSYMLFWYFFTVAYNIANKNALMALPFPASIVWAQLLISALIILPLWVVQAPKFTKGQLQDTSVLSLLHTLGVLTSAISMQAGSISFLQIVKASEPVFVAVVSVLLGSRLLPLPVYLTLIPVIAGVALASVKDLSFSWGSFLPAVLSNTLHPVRMVLFKKYLAKWTAEQQQTDTTSTEQPNHAVVKKAASPLSSSAVFQLLTLLGVVLLLPIVLIVEGGGVLHALRAIVDTGADMVPPLSESLRYNDRLKSLLMNIGVSGVSYYLYNEVCIS